jgi:hypothetical protein
MTSTEELKDLTSFEYFGVVEEPDGWNDEPETKRYGNRGNPSAQCACGRFAKHVRTERYYNGFFDTVSMTVDCSRCGEVSIRLV